MCKKTNSDALLQRMSVGGHTRSGSGARLLGWRAEGCGFEPEMTQIARKIMELVLVEQLM